MSSSRIISEKFTAFDTWPFGSRRLCVACAWAYSRQPTKQPALLITDGAVTEYAPADEATLADVLMRGPLPGTHAVVLPSARRRHILPATQWGHLATDGLVIRWAGGAASKLTDLAWLRTTIAATRVCLPARVGRQRADEWKQLSRSAPPSQLMIRQLPEHWPRILTAWTQLQSWRTNPSLWECARILTQPCAQ